MTRMTRLGTAALLAAAIAGSCAIASQSTPDTPTKGCKVTNLAVTVESRTPPGQTEPKAFRWVRTETVRCGDKSGDLVTNGDWQRHPPLR